MDELFTTTLAHRHSRIMSITLVLITDYRHIIGKKKNIKCFVIENLEQSTFSRSLGGMAMAGLIIQIKKNKASTLHMQVAEALEVDYHQE